MSQSDFGEALYRTSPLPTRATSWILVRFVADEGSLNGLLGPRGAFLVGSFGPRLPGFGPPLGLLR